MKQKIKKAWQEAQAGIMARCFFSKYGLSLSPDNVTKLNSTHDKVRRNLEVVEFVRRSERKYAEKMLNGG